MTNRHTLRFSIFAAAILALCLPAAAAAQWGRYPQDRYPDDRGYGRYDDRGLRDSANRLDRLSKDFERDVDRALDHSRANGTDREDRVNDQVHQFRNAVRDFKSRVGNGRDLNRSANEARRMMQEAQDVDRIARRLDGRTSSQWYQIQQELRYISNVYGIGYGGYGRDDDWRRNDDYRRNDGRRNDRNNDWWRRIPFPRY